MKQIRFTKHALEQCLERGATEEEVRFAIVHGTREETKLDRVLCRCNFPYNKYWQGKYYTIKQVAPVIKKENEIVVITVYTFYF